MNCRQWYHAWRKAVAEWLRGEEREPGLNRIAERIASEFARMSPGFLLRLLASPLTFEMKTKEYGELCVEIMLLEAKPGYLFAHVSVSAPEKVPETSYFPVSAPLELTWDASQPGGDKESDGDSKHENN